LVTVGVENINETAERASISSSKSRFERGRKEIGGRTGHAALMNAILESAAQLGGKDEVVSYFKGLAQNRLCTFGRLLLKLIPKPSRPTRAS
jgi:hypothetical protein